MQIDWSPQVCDYFFASKKKLLIFFCDSFPLSIYTIRYGTLEIDQYSLQFILTLFIDSPKTSILKNTSRDMVVVLIMKKESKDLKGS